MKKLTVGAYDVKCPACETLMMTLRVGRMDSVTKITNVHARCESCKHTNRVSVKLELRFDEKYEAFSKKLSKRPIAPARPAAPTKHHVKRTKRTKRPTTRTYAGLKGRIEGKGRRAEWHFTYPTKYAPLLLRAKKYLGEWDVYFGELRMGSGNTLVDALEQAKRRMANRGHDLVV